MKSYQFDLPSFGEADGKLGTFEPASIPGFKVERIFYIYDVPESETRADHACMNASIVFMALIGTIRLLIETSGEMTEYLIDSRSTAVFVPSASWIKAYDFSKNAVLVGLSDRRYVDCQYINDYERYKELVGEVV